LPSASLIISEVYILVAGGEVTDLFDDLVQFSVTKGLGDQTGLPGRQ